MLIMISNVAGPIMWCTGQRIDGPSNGSAPLPWDVRCNATQLFHSEVRHIEVPHTAIVTVRCAYVIIIITIIINNAKMRVALSH